MRMNRKKKIPKAEPPLLVHPVKPMPPPTRANPRMSFRFEMTRLDLVSTRWKFRGAKRREDSGQISSGGLVSNSRSYDFKVHEYQSENLARSCDPPLVGPWWIG